MTDPDDLRAKLKLLTDHVMTAQRRSGCICDPAVEFDVPPEDDDADLLAIVAHAEHCPRLYAAHVN